MATLPPIEWPTTVQRSPGAVAAELGGDLVGHRDVGERGRPGGAAVVGQVEERHAGVLGERPGHAGEVAALPEEAVQQHQPRTVVPVRRAGQALRRSGRPRLRAHGRRCQQPVCQCRRSSTGLVVCQEGSAGQTTTCGVAGGTDLLAPRAPVGLLRRGRPGRSGRPRRRRPWSPRRRGRRTAGGPGAGACSVDAPRHQSGRGARPDRCVAEGWSPARRAPDLGWRGASADRPVPGRLRGTADGPPADGHPPDPGQGRRVRVDPRRRPGVQAAQLDEPALHAHRAPRAAHPGAAGRTPRP